MTESVLISNNSAEPVQSEERSEPPAYGRWLLTLLVTACFIGLQLVLALPVMQAVMIRSDARTAFEAQAAFMSFLESESGLLVTVLIAAVSGVATVLVAFAWPWVWRLIIPEPRFGVSEWLAWRPPHNLPLWAVPTITLPVLLGLGMVVVGVFGEVQVDTQLALFSSPLLAGVSALVVSLVAPIAEETVFRGALYNALLGSPRRAAQNWTRHILPFVITSLAFALVHLAAGFERMGSIVMILLLSMFLTGLRAVTNSLQASVLAHTVWNLAGAASLIAANLSGMVR